MKATASTKRVASIHSFRQSVLALSTVRIVPNYSALGSGISRNGNKHALPHFELARVFVRFDHVASVIVNANHSVKILVQSWLREGLFQKPKSRESSSSPISKKNVIMNTVTNAPLSQENCNSNRMTMKAAAPPQTKNSVKLILWFSLSLPFAPTFARRVL